MEYVDILVWIVVFLTSIPLLTLSLECILAWFPRSPRQFAPDLNVPRTVILIPAHNEESHIESTLTALQGRMGINQQILVVADNCTDKTAEIVRALQIPVVERQDPTRRGKGYALAYGRETLSSSPPDVVIVVDADCALAEDTLRRLAIQATRRGCPIQAEYLMVAPPNAPPQRRVSAFAFFIKNAIRPLGLSKIGGPCILTGTGMAFTWETFQMAKLADGHIVEDLGMAVELALKGRHAEFFPEGQVTSEFPVDEAAAKTQRKRWEHGHLGVILRWVPRLLLLSIIRSNPRLLLLALEIGVPPLSALVILSVVIAIVLSTVTLLGGDHLPLIIFSAAISLTGFALAFTWLLKGRKILPVIELVRIPLYILAKTKLYLGFFIRPEKNWIRTSRN